MSVKSQSKRSCTDCWNIFKIFSPHTLLPSALHFLQLQYPSSSCVKIQLNLIKYCLCLALSQISTFSLSGGGRNMGVCFGVKNFPQAYKEISFLRLFGGVVRIDFPMDRFGAWLQW